ncbi:uncharacterized protein Dwil_GK13487 [Drosophila willistoni]|uniref:MADF domain-containing protein n=1 Tax=Drosophila willistoni TaxID=7260 RepID=B4NIT0_DROWI|nr:uncharacterized protein LOC6650535 [Drosophila willistoni]EDW83794.1 uncharacterized protein Dwil_GK13487 [Drosophila willistoni]
MSGEFSASQFVSSNGNLSASASCSSRWLTEEVFKLIDIVQRDEAIYNPRHKYYFCRPYVENFWREVDIKLEKNPGASLAKWTNLRISFRREYTNYLEEKVPPCWSYFDRMFFLHPYLRKKHQQPKSLDTQVQDALAHLSSLSNRMQRERTVAISTSSNSNPGHPNTATQLSPQPQQMDNYLDYFDEAEPNQSELDEMMDEEQRARFHNQLDNNDIKSECEEPVDDYEQDHVHDHDEDEVPEPDDHDQMHKMAATSSSAASSSVSEMQRRYHQHQLTHSSNRQLHVNRLQVRAYQEEMRIHGRPRSQEQQNSSGSAQTPAQAHSNISFVRPTFSKPVDMVSTTTHSAGVSLLAASSASHDLELPTPSSVAGSIAPPAGLQQQRHAGHHPTSQHQQQQQPLLRLEANNSSGSMPSSGGSGSAGVGNVVELCDCKTDSDAMFLMSLLPDIQKLNGRDRGKIKIAFQNILQDYLYPD